MSRKDISDEMVCKAYIEAKRLGSVYPYDLLEQWTGQPFKVCWRAMERAVERGYIEYGVSLRSGWVEPKGLELITKSINQIDPIYKALEEK